MQKRLLNILFLIFTLSGFSGLIYESIWTHYLKLFLGHAAYAQTLVLAIFMGGMAFGAWLCSRYSVRWKNLLIGYALAEGAVGLFAMVFHNVFDQTVQLSYSSILPHMSSAGVANIFKWTLSALLILPQSILLGMTFPLMSAGIIRLSPKNPGRTISLLYFANSVGAAIGVLVSGFILIRLIGLPWTIRAAGLINIALALSVWLLMKGRSTGAIGVEAIQGKEPEDQSRRWNPLFLFASFITGVASFIYEIGWIRMLNLVLGTSTHAFELMLSAFILGLALGGLWLQRRIDRITVPGRFLAQVQVIMGLLALSTLVLYGKLFEIMQWLVMTLSKTDRGYALFNLSSSAIAMLIMLPTTFCAGMTLPLITFHLIKQGQGERSIGAVYAANTVGAILGVFFAIHVGMPFLGLKGLITVGASLDIALGVILLWRTANYSSNRLPAAMTATALCAVAVTVFFVHLDPYKMASGVYRSGQFYSPLNTDILFYEDGKTATISLLRMKETGVMSIITNGKPDASLYPEMQGRTTTDESTMILMGVLPMALNPQARTVANIGLGSGLTTHTLLSNPSLQQVDTVEIERYMVDAAKNIGPRVGLVYTDPRSKIFIDDAKTFFSVHNKKYDIIVSEPSNPWVSGVASLFSDDFYHLLNRHLKDSGLFVQWLQLYEIDVDLIMSVLKAISANFSDYVVYATNDFDALIIAKKKGTIPDYDPAVFKIPAISAALEHVRIHSIQDIEIRKIGNKKFLSKLLEASPIRPNSDYYPVLDQNAAHARFLMANAYDMLNLSRLMLPVFELLTGSEPAWETTDVTLSPLFTKSEAAYSAMALRDYALQGRFGPKYSDVPSGVEQQALQLKRTFYNCRSMPDQIERRDNLINASVEMIPYLRPHEFDAVWKRLESGPCTQFLSTLERNWIDLLKSIGKRNSRKMVSGAKTLLEGEQQIPPDAIKFVVASGMLGSLMQGDREESFRLWSTYRSRMFGNGQPDLLFRLLVADSTIPD